MRRGLVCGIFLTMVAFASALHAQDSLTIHRDVISGLVTNDSSKGLAGVEVIISMAPDRSFLKTLTDQSGHYEIVAEHGTGDYLVHVSAPAMKTVRKRVTRQGVDSVFVVNVTLKGEGAEQLTAVQVTAERPTPSRNGDYGLAPGTGAMEHTGLGDVKGAVTPDLAGNIAAIAATNPTLLVTPNGVSTGGVASQQNSTTLNGMSFQGTDIPRDAVTGVRVRTSVYDPSEGWFGSAQQAVALSSGSLLVMRHAHLTLDAPLLQYTDPYSRQVGQQFTNFQASIGGAGALNRDRMEYNYGVQGSRRVADGISLSSASDDVLERANIAPDSAARLLGALGTLGVPLDGQTQRTTNTASFIGLIGSRAIDLSTFRPTRTEWDIVGYAKAARTSNIASSPTSTRGYSGVTSNGIASLQAHLSTYVHDVYLMDARSAVSVAHTSTSPFKKLPAGVVFLDSDMGDGTGGVSAISFGGNSSIASELTQSTWETAANIKLYSPGSATHRIKIAADSRLDSWRQAIGSNSAGMFVFNSIGEVAANSPISFTRTLNVPTQSATVWNGFLSAGDWWHKSDAFQLLYGARLEGDRFLTAPQYNETVARVFGARTDFTPNTVHVSPRIGFTYTMRQSRSAADYSIVPISGGPIGYLRGGVGEFRTLMSPELVAGVSARTGLAAASRTITCVGSATPSPLWSQYAVDPSLIPSDCIGGAAQSAFVDAAPGVELLDRSYTAPRSWRANLAYGSAFHGVAFSVEGLYSLNINQPGLTDLNFMNSQQFITSDENRPVYVSSPAIVPGSGALVLTSSRQDSSFGQVLNHVSSLKSVGRQVTFSISPDIKDLKGWFMSMAYTISDTRSFSSGFDNSTFASPTVREWSRGGFDARHRMVLQGGVSKGGLTVTLFGRIQSGFPFTPMIGSDVNGDGFVNDRAFIFDPARASDPSLVLGMKSLMQSSQGNVSQCLASQLQRAASSNSCEGPWTASLNAQMDYRFAAPRTRQHASVTLALMNPLGGLDQALHGVDHLRGWGTSTLPDPVLYNVRGFDPVAKRYLYEVNSRFGDTRPSAGVARVPFGISLDFSIDLAPPSDEQLVEMQVKPGRNGHSGQRLSAATIRRRYDMIMPDPFRAIIEESDSLMLSRNQVDALTEAGDKYDALREPILAELSEYLGGLGDHYSSHEILRKQNDAFAAVWDLGHSWIRQTLPGILNRFQLKMLPWPASQFYTEPASVTGKDILSR
jgi:hypothetical protein